MKKILLIIIFIFNFSFIFTSTSLSKTFYIGDDKRDIEAAYNANTYIVYIGKKKLTKEEKIKYKLIILNKKIHRLYNEKIKYNF